MERMTERSKRLIAYVIFAMLALTTVGLLALVWHEWTRQFRTLILLKGAERLLVVRQAVVTGYRARFPSTIVLAQTGTNEMQLTELMEAIDSLRKAGWTVEPPKRQGARASLVTKPKRMGRPPKNGRRKRGRPRKIEQV
jgi:hypothetical protein